MTTPDYAAIFGVNFRAARIRAGLNIFDISKQTGIGFHHVTLIELGRLSVTIKDMGTLAEAVGCRLSTLVEADRLFNGDELGAKLPTIEN